MNITKILLRPAPVWLSLVRLVIVCGFLLLMSYDGNFKPVAAEIALAVKEFRLLMERAEEAERIKQKGQFATP